MRTHGKKSLRLSSRHKRRDGESHSDEESDFSEDGSVYESCWHRSNITCAIYRVAGWAFHYHTLLAALAIVLMVVLSYGTYLMHEKIETYQAAKNSLNHPVWELGKQILQVEPKVTSLRSKVKMQQDSFLETTFHCDDLEDDAKRRIGEMKANATASGSLEVTENVIKKHAELQEKVKQLQAQVDQLQQKPKS